MDTDKNAKQEFLLNTIVKNIEKTLYGKKNVIELALCAILSNGHILIEDVPGVGKTSLAYGIAKTFSSTFSRIQFTPDLMPSDITGFSIFNPQKGTFEHKEGAIVAQFVLADEINRAMPRTQSSLLEAMEERQVSVDGVTYKLPKPFIVLATQNPVEQLGTTYLPEAQLDRFFMRISIGYPSKKAESYMLSMYDQGEKIIQSVASTQNLLYLQNEVKKIYVDEKIKNYITSLIRATREHKDIRLGASPRASLNLYRASQAWALYKQRDFVIPDDVIYLFPHIVEHRIVLKNDVKLKETRKKEILQEIVKLVKIKM